MNADKINLDAPGAGLPVWERLFLNTVFKTACWVVTDSRALKLFEKEAETIYELVNALDPEKACRAVLIPRITGIEDSSRNWSCYMVLEHLAIVNDRIIEQIEALGCDTLPDEHVDIADFKPSNESNEQSTVRFTESARDFASRINELGAIDTIARFPHPWFGSLNAHQWLCLAAIHMRIHRKQIEKILSDM